MGISEFSNIEASVKEIKEEMLLDMDPYSFVSASAYDTAWLAMVPLDSDRTCARFKECLEWVANNQTTEGYWGECPAIDSLPATLACLIALHRWNVGANHVKRGLNFLQENAEKILGKTYDELPRWFTIVFPGMIELARKAGIELAFPSQLDGLLSDIFRKRQSLLDNEELVVGNQYYPPLLSYLEALPSWYDVSEEEISMNLSGDGSLFQSPAATARAFMATGNQQTLSYLQMVVGRCANGVPPTFPMDEDLIRLCLVNQLQRLGLADHFTREIEDNLAQIYWNYKTQESPEKSSNNADVAIQLHKDSLAFRLLRMHGYTMSPGQLCWFLNNKNVRAHIEENHENFSISMLNVYRATDLKFPGEDELEEARSFSRKVLEKISLKDTSFGCTGLKKMVEHELRFPWIARLDRLDHRAWIEDINNSNILWVGKTSAHRLSTLLNKKLLQLAVAEYEFRQSIYRNELEEVTRWSKSRGMSDMGFGRERTTFCYFAIASSIPLPYDSEVRMIITKSAVVITVADDFYDSEASIDELNNLTDAIARWDAEGLSGHSKTIFNALHDLVSEIVAKVLHQQGIDITVFLQQIWYETFNSWLVEAEAKWSTGGLSMEEYLGTGMVSIALHTIVLPASYLLNPSLTYYKVRAGEYPAVTKLSMMIPRLLNDIQSYQKEQEEGKTNYVLLYMRENPGADIEDSTTYVRGIVENKWGEFLQHVLMDDGSGELPKGSKFLHLSCVKVFQMFFHSSNRYDSNTDILQDIQKAIYIPLNIG
ncbi:terpene synthase 04, GERANYLLINALOOL SYNTHASE, TERPENE SYNTHASE 4 [Hibiscus trionum]|uniref:Terpene synthase 04, GERANYLLINALOOL SYNTHASE, TERPENE SYNTHASE 4 n=1 Tax=Hibiscus trionum TaxID=183268 RepID=A0A9W7LYA6_HIBTR|nr:terpene synthase 04, GERANYLLINALOOL SYNTHASE, TERPENE SYNTHASE 4 [Hibiscus trionum]